MKRRLNYNSKYEKFNQTGIEKRVVKLKNGDEKIVVEDLDKIARNAALIEKMAARDNCIEIFRDLPRTLDPMSNRRRVDHSRYCRTKMKREMSHMCYRILNTAIKLCALQGICMLKAILARARYARELFLLAVESSEPTKIPEDLSQSHLPLSYRYYDPILALIQEGLSDEVKLRARLMQKTAFEKYLEYN